MTTVVAALLGVVVGGLLSGAVQMTVAWRERQRAGRVAARLLYMHLWWAEGGLDLTVKAQGWSDLADWEGACAAWAEQRVALAGALNTNDFLVIAAAFTGIERLRKWSAADLAAKPAGEGAVAPFSGGPLISTYRPYIQKAMLIVHRASFSRWERLWGKAKPGEGETIRHPPRPPIKDGGPFTFSD
jgi:hypothetical protein